MQTADRVVEPDRVAEIHQVVNRIHERLRFDTPPFPFEDFLSAYESYKVFEIDLPQGLDGKLLITPDGEKKIVHLRSENPRPRVRFTLAHEIIHSELHFHEGKLCNNRACRTSDRFRDGERSVEELEADYGAAALLIPLPILERYLPSSDPGSWSDLVVRRLARVFGVSERTTAIQLELLARTRGL